MIRLINGPTELNQALNLLLRRATTEIGLLDHSLDRSFDSPARIGLLRDLLRHDRRNRIRIILHESDTLARDCPRLLALQRRFSCAVAIHRTESHARKASDPLVLADRHACLHRFHYRYSRASLLLDDVDSMAPLAARFEEIREASLPAVSAAILGL